jgi:hypothetical protein
MKQRLAAIALAVTASVHASEGTLSLSPAVIMLRGQEGQSTTQTVMLHNGTSRKLSFSVVAEDVVVRDGKRVFVPAGKGAGSIAATAVFSARSVSLGPGEKAAVTATFTIPRQTTGRAVVVLFRGNDKLKNGPVSATASLGSLLTFALTDGVAMKTEPLAVQPQTATTSLAVAQTLTNSGTEPLVAKGMLAVIGDDGRLAGKAALAPRRLLPGERSTLGAEYSAELAPGHYRLLVTYDYEGRALTQSAEVDVR